MLAILRRLKWVMGGCAPRLAWFDRQSFARKIFSDILALGAAMGGGCEHHSGVGKRYAGCIRNGYNKRMRTAT